MGKYKCEYCHKTFDTIFALYNEPISEKSPYIIGEQDAEGIDVVVKNICQDCQKFFKLYVKADYFRKRV